jgi:hypothetical protein
MKLDQDVLGLAVGVVQVVANLSVEVPDAGFLARNRGEPYRKHDVASAASRMAGSYICLPPVFVELCPIAVVQRLQFLLIGQLAAQEQQVLHEV